MILKDKYEPLICNRKKSGFLLTEEWEVVPFSSAVANGIVHSGGENSRGQDANWQFTEHLGPKVGADLVHSIVGFSQKHWSLIRENQDDILNCIETEDHDDEEKRAISVLDTSQVLSDFGKKNDAKTSSQKCNNQFDITCLGKSQ